MIPTFLLVIKLLLKGVLLIEVRFIFFICMEHVLSTSEQERDEDNIRGIEEQINSICITHLCNVFIYIITYYKVM